MKRSPKRAFPLTRMTASLERAVAGEPVYVGTLNPAKCDAVRGALDLFRSADRHADAQPQQGIGTAQRPRAEVIVAPALPAAVPGIRIVAVAVESGVPEQPIGFEQIIAGARNRARAALGAGDGVLAVGIEDGLVGLAVAGDARSDGLVENPFPTDNVFNIGCAWVTDGEREGSGFSSGFAYPTECLERALQDQEPIGDLFDRLWRRHRDPTDPGHSGRTEGNIGKLTGGRLTRSDYAGHAVLCALVRFLQQDLYD